MQPQQVNLPPTYQQILKAMGEQLSQRKGALMKRVLLIVWPFILLFVIGYVFEEFINLKAWSDAAVMKLIIAGSVYVLISAIYVGVIKYIFSIEKLIWVDSFFDGKNLSLGESWRIAIKIIVPDLKFRIRVFIKYYLWLALLPVVWIAGFIINLKEYSVNSAAMLVVGLLVIGVVGIVYSYYMRTKLRYAHFVFLDKVGTTATFGDIENEFKKLNEISKSETFRKSLIASFGTDVATAIAQTIVSTLSTVVGTVGSFAGEAAGRMLGGITQVYGQELARQVGQLANISAQYILYRFARKEAFGLEQHVNEELYR